MNYAETLFELGIGEVVIKHDDFVVMGLLNEKRELTQK